MKDGCKIVRLEPWVEYVEMMDNQNDRVLFSSSDLELSMEENKDGKYCLYSIAKKEIDYWRNRCFKEEGKK